MLLQDIINKLLLLTAPYLTDALQKHKAMKEIDTEVLLWKQP